MKHHPFDPSGMILTLRGVVTPTGAPQGRPTPRMVLTLRGVVICEPLAVRLFGLYSFALKQEGL
jgi:hypothetical protein